MWLVKVPQKSQKAEPLGWKVHGVKEQDAVKEDVMESILKEKKETPGVWERMTWRQRKI